MKPRPSPERLPLAETAGNCRNTHWVSGASPVPGSAPLFSPRSLPGPQCLL